MNGITLFQSSLGGAILGATSVIKMAINGRILGISGTTKGIINGNFEPWRFSFTSGLILGGFAASHLLPQAFQTINLSYQRLAMSGLLVGIGSSMGNGCTSGHGICGNARFSIRSLIYTCVFMISGILTATLTKTAEALDISRIPPAISVPSESLLKLSGIITACSIFVLGFPMIISKFRRSSEALKPDKIVDNLSELSTGTVFGVALGLSGMTRPDKVAAFLSPFHPGFDPSLACVMGCALIVAIPGFYLILKNKNMKLKKSLCNNPINVPTKMEIDLKLIFGGILFGMGWGLGGICPGPAIVNLAKPSIEIGIFLACLALGFLIEPKSNLADFGFHKK